MLVEDSIKLIKNCADAMNSMYGNVVFDEWVLFSVTDDKVKILSYMGPRKQDFAVSFQSDLGELRPKLLAHEYHPGDFEFARYANGTSFEAFMVAGGDVYLLCNNTGCNMEIIAKDARWLSAQIPFVELAETFRKNPVIDWS
jgi:hypothetical protein